MKKKKQTNSIKKTRIPLPKQRNQAFRVQTKYNKKDKSWKLDLSSFV
ncbi:MAG TPA: hypothetical protein PLH46_06340 [Caldisericia bacterium]|nr:hypothetical protein [Caldisericia bacterium]